MVTAGACWCGGYHGSGVRHLSQFNYILENFMPETTRDPLLVEREKTHGSFQLNAGISQQLKRIMNTQVAWDKMDSRKREALDMIALKLSRILSGQANFKDHWDDIAGYAKLGAEACE